jgi:hypothetical protein
MSDAMDKRSLAPYFKNAITKARFTTGQIGPMTTAAELLSQAATNKSGLHYEDQREIDRVINAQTGELPLAIGMSVFTNANVAAANTVEGLENIVEALDPTLAEDHFTTTNLNP